MINPKELRISNLVQVKEKILIVSALSKLSIILEDEQGEDYGMYSNDSDYVIDPIPITEEWLLRFGFKVWGSFNYLYKNRSATLDVTIARRTYVNSDYISYKLNNNYYEIKIEYVHKLQNLYFALTGQELEIKK